MVDETDISSKIKITLTSDVFFYLWKCKGEVSKGGCGGGTLPKLA